MFGYVTCDKPNMRIKDFAQYKAFYCGLCKTLGKNYSLMTRFTVNFDITFLTLLAHNYQKLTPVFKNQHCITHPIGKRFPIVQNNRIQQCVADINIILGYFKATDDALDDKKLKYKLARSFLHNKFKKSAKKYPALAAFIQDKYQELRRLEKQRETSLDKLAHPFSMILVEVARTACQKTDDNLEELCYNLGKWIYLIDAYDDLSTDLKNQKFNPLLPNGAASLDEIKKIRQNTAQILNQLVACIVKAYDNMEITITDGPLSNIIYMGLRARTQQILSQKQA